MWLFRAFCDEKVLAEYNDAKAELATRTTERNGARGTYKAMSDSYKRANSELAACQLSAQRARRAAADAYNAMKDIYLGQLAEKRDELDRANDRVSELEEALRERDAELEQLREVRGE